MIKTSTLCMVVATLALGCGAASPAVETPEVPDPPELTPDPNRNPLSTAEEHEVDCSEDGELMTWFRDLGGDDPAAALAAAEQLEQLQPEYPYCTRQVRYARAAFVSGEPKVVAAAVHAAIKHDQLLPAAIELLDHQDATVRREALEVMRLRRHVHVAPKVGAMLVDDPDSDVVSNAARYFEVVPRSALRHYEDQLIPSLSKGLQSEDRAQRERVLEVIALAGLESSVSLIAPMLDSDRADNFSDSEALIVALVRIDKDWPVHEHAPAWLRKVALLFHEYRDVYLPHRDNLYLSEMFEACGVDKQPPKDGQGTELEALKAFGELKKIAAKIRKAQARIKQKRRKKIVDRIFGVYRTQIYSFPHCKRMK